ncbi:hypothetical protein DOK_11961 [gamma proteobacterium BDW918]|nr:hypothetical protein DOK_11961 [gamma proteobacterium BDW918]
MKRDSTEMKRRMQGRWLSAFNALAPALSHAVSQVGQNVPCPISGGTDGFRLFKDANFTGGGVKQSERVIPEGIGMLMWVNDWSFPEAYDALLEWLDGNSVQPGPIYLPDTKPMDETALRAWLNRIWREALPLDHTMSYPARAYFSYRRVLRSALAARDIRFHPNLNYKGKGGVLLGTYPAIICLVRNNNGAPVGIHRTFITKGGLKVEMEGGHKPRKLTPTVSKESKGRVIRANEPVAGVLGVAEGLETALSVMEARSIPVWPGLSNTMLQSFVPPTGVHTVINFLDKDRNKASENSAVIVEQNLTRRGIRVISLLPPLRIPDSEGKGVDWADQWCLDPNGFWEVDRILSELNTTAA